MSATAETEPVEMEVDKMSNPKKQKSKNEKESKSSRKPLAVSLPHPKYCEMIHEALTALKERQGSSRQAILKYIVKNFTVQPDEKIVNNHLKMSLRAGVKSGKLKQIKGSGACGSYKLGENVKVSKNEANLTKVKKPKAAGMASPKKSPKKSSPKKAKSPKKKTKKSKNVKPTSKDGIKPDKTKEQNQSKKSAKATDEPSKQEKTESEEDETEVEKSINVDQKKVKKASKHKAPAKKDKEEEKVKEAPTIIEAD